MLGKFDLSVEKYNPTSFAVLMPQELNNTIGIIYKINMFLFIVFYLKVPQKTAVIVLWLKAVMLGSNFSSNSKHRRASPYRYRCFISSISP